jgi:hypothetical protein
MAINNQDDSLEYHDAKKVVIHLIDESAEHLSATQLHQLKRAREQALAAMPDSLNNNVGQARGVALLGSYFSHHRRTWLTFFGSVLVITLLLVLISNHERGDADLLASDLPPEAYIDGDFDQWLSDSH